MTPIEIFRHHKAGNYLAALRLLEAAVATPEGAGLGQLLATEESFVGLYAGAIETFARLGGEPAPAPAPAAEERALRDLLASVRLEPAVAAICRRARDRQVVILNEHHHIPQHRAFGRQLLGCLREAGFDVFAMEALGEDGPALVTRGGVSREHTGFYTVEPQMAGLVRDALVLGFRLVSYESRDECEGCTMDESIDRREEDQARNLVEAIFAGNPQERVFIWVGYGHGSKRQRNESPRSRWMATRLWQMTQIEPYSIQQISDESDRSEPLYRSVTEVTRTDSPVYVDVAAMWPQLPAFLRDAYGGWERPRLPRVDGVVIHPRRRAEDPRAAWLYAPADHSREVRVTCASCREGERVVVQAFRPNDDPEDAVAVDQVLCEAASPCELVVPPGRYVVRLWAHEAIVGTREADLVGANVPVSIEF